MDLLLDTSVIIDHFGNRGDFADAAHKVMAMGLFGDANLWVTSNAFVDAFYIMRKAVDPHQIQAAFAHSLGCIHVCSAGQEDLATAFGRSWADLEDCLASVCAEKVHADYIVTRDKRGFSASGVPCISPEDLLAQMQADNRITYAFEDL